MRFRDCLDRGDFAVALEILPPQRNLPKVLLRRARLIEGWSHAINVIQRPDRQSSLEASLALCEAGIEPAWHLVTRGRSREEIAADLDRAKAAGVKQVLCILGDHAAQPGVDSVTIREAVAMARAALPEAVVGATVNQYGPDREAVLRNLLPKLAAGASYVQTQPVFDAAQVEEIGEALEAAHPGTRLIAMAMPLLSIEAGERIEERLSIRLPDGLREVLASGDQEAAWHAFTATLRTLVRSPRVHGVAIMTFEGDAPAGTGERIVRCLRDAGLAPVKE
jgi:methylenetetrahydrofolate reductase (NADPH)